MRQLAFAGAVGPTGTPSPEVEALILVAMTVVFTWLARGDAPHPGAAGPRARAVSRSAGDERRDAATGRLGRAARLRPGAAPSGRGSADTARELRRRRPASAGSMEANWTDPLLFFIYSVAKPVARALILVVMLEVIGGPAAAAFRGVRRRRQRALGVRHERHRRPGLVGPRRPRALPDAEVRLRQPERLPASCSWAGASRASPSGPWAPSSRSPSASSSSASRSIRARSTGRCSSSSCSSGWPPSSPSGVILAAVCLQTRQESWSYPEAVAGALFLVVRRRLPARRPARPRPGGRTGPAADLVDRGRSAGALPRRAGRPSAARVRCGRALTGTAAPDRGDHRGRLAGDERVVTLAAVGRLPRERARAPRTAA